jgi:hypothetical protein
MSISTMGTIPNLTNISNSKLCATAGCTWPAARMADLCRACWQQSQRSDRSEWFEQQLFEEKPAARILAPIAEGKFALNCQQWERRAGRNKS